MYERTDCSQIGAQHGINTAHADRNYDDNISRPGSLLKWKYVSLRWLNNTELCFFYLKVAC